MNLFYHVYCSGILGVETNVSDFRWVYGSVAPAVSYEEYDKCKVKFRVYVKPEKQLNSMKSIDKRFQAFAWNDEDETLYYRRKFFRFIDVGYNIKIEKDTVYAEIGENYYRFIKNRMMNLHGVYYLLSDIANIVLLSNGFLTMYASAVHNVTENRGIVCFGAPNTGKTFTATKLCEFQNYYLVGEDIIISDGRKIYACTWTTSYRKTSDKGSDSVGSGKRINMVGSFKSCESCGLTDVALLSLGKEKTNLCKEDILSKVCIVNGYLFNYCSSPVVKVFSFFDYKFSLSWQEKAEKMLKDILEQCNCCLIQCETPFEFTDKIRYELLGEKI